MRPPPCRDASSIMCIQAGTWSQPWSHEPRWPCQNGAGSMPTAASTCEVLSGARVSSKSKTRAMTGVVV